VVKIVRGPEKIEQPVETNIEPTGSREVVLVSDEPSSQKRLDRALLGGIAWTAAMKWIGQVLTWGITLIVARLLQPSDYGLIGMAVIYVGLVQLLSEFGLGTAIITMRDLTDDQVSQLNTLSLLLGVLCFAASVAVAIPIARFFRAPKLAMVIVVMSIAFLVSAFSTIPYSLLQKEMRFKLLAVMDASQSISQAICTLALAFLGFGYWALVIGNLSLSFATAGLTLARRRQRFAWPRAAALRGPLLFSWHIIVGRLSWYVYDNSDFLVAGRVLGQAPLGAYSLAWTLAHAPLEKLTGLVNRVTPSVFSAVQNDHAALRRYLRTITGAMALIVFPATVGMALVANEFVRMALGAKWVGVVLPLELLAFHALLKSNVILTYPVLTAIRSTRFTMWQSLANLVILPVSFYIGSRWGTGGIAGVWVLVFPLLQISVYWHLFRGIEMTTKEYFGALWPAASGCVLMAVAVGALKHFLNPTWPDYARFAVEVLAGISVYALALIAMHRERLVALARLVRNFRAQPA
jgi:O-antigen/teichoic acid export membrane protein